MSKENVMAEVTEFAVSTHAHTEFVSLDRNVNEIVTKSGITNGLCMVFIPHTTAAITINENTDPDVQRDIIAELNKIIPLQNGYYHMEGNSAAHIKASLIGTSESVIIENGKLKLGTWQSLFLCEFDGPRQRRVWVKIIEY